MPQGSHLDIRIVGGKARHYNRDNLHSIHLSVNIPNTTQNLAAPNCNYVNCGFQTFSKKSDNSQNHTHGYEFGKSCCEESKYDSGRSVLFMNAISQNRHKVW